ncbi:ring-cleaving dioxygenase [Saccharibacillus alkalitolerans]|uniref:Ring-cleaving dioxygenase n=1 Tax=Saccharibacillus alkalitolerans TaxID=2705290 RepID=A0ABX0F9Y3_9BACL|nr:ring-cleaving dioxygenase [Saccharibacillus alkalitolerans]NGZ77751.1 ring-cleaving dioxygenase [Saccharibacillus alkalitolerans]
MALQTAGIHHITAFAGDPQANVDFYAGVLGLRLVKKTINFDAPDVYHLYFGNEEGAPGTIITFFPFSGARRGRIGGGQVGFTTYVIPVGASAFWKKRLRGYGISVTEAERFGEHYLQFKDNEGLQLELVEREEGPESGWSFGGVPANQAIKGFGGAVLYSVNPERTAQVLETVLGMEKIGEYAGFVRFRATGELGNLIDLPMSAVPRGAGGAGTVHHIAWRAADFDEHDKWRGAVSEGGFQPTPVIDRQYFHAVYFREEGGILFEIATDPPGFAVDETPDELGEGLMLPAWYEDKRRQIEDGLLPIEVREREANAGQ